MDVDREEFRSVEAFLSRLVLAYVNANLYPEEHSLSKKAVQDMFDSLKYFIDFYGNLVLEVQSDHFKYKTYPLSSVKGSGDLAYRFHRDGIEWLMFVEGVDASEMKALLDIVNAHRTIEEDSGDIVTSLWEEGLRGVQYYTDPTIWRHESLLDVSRFRVQSQAGGRSEETRTEHGDTHEGVSLEPRTDRGLWQLTPQEREKTRQMVAEEESRDLTGDLCDVLLVLLEQWRSSEDVTRTLEIMRECFVKLLSRGHFRYASRFLAQFYQIRQDYAQKGHWALAYLDDFLQLISGSRVMFALEPIMEGKEAIPSREMESLSRMLVQLQPESIDSLGRLLPGTASREAAKHLRASILKLARKDLRPLVRLVRNEEPEVVREAIAILGRIPDTRVDHALLEATRSREPSVRRSAAQWLTTRQTKEWASLLPLLADSDTGVRNTVYYFLVSKRHPEVEDSVITRIRQTDLEKKDSFFLHLLYRVLGNCGSQRCCEFLREQLFKGPLRLGRLSAAHRAGAATALTLLRIPEARNLLQQASKSPWPSIRRAILNAREQPYDH